MSIAYKSKVNERVTGSPISLEPHTVGIVGVFTVVPNVIRLVEVPQGPGPAVSIYGYTETLTPSPSGTQFYVDYPTGVITFNASQNGHSVLVSYTGLGSEIAAEDINELQIPVGIALNADGSLSAGIVTTTSLSGSLVLPFTTLQTLNNSIVPVTNGSGYLISSATTATELGYLSGAASNIQAQLNALSSGTITSVVGTMHEIIASTSFGVVTLSTPQAIDTTSSPTFYSLTLTNPLTVGNGGTGDSSHTAYAVLTGGTTSTGALQSVSGVGTSGQVLTSNGASTLPTWQTLITPSGITALTGDITATGPGSVAATLSTVNSNVGSFTNANITVNAKGLITAASNGSAGGVTGVKTGAGSPETGTITLTAGTNITIVDSPAGTFTINATSGGSGTVNSGTANQLAYYSATGTAVSGSSILSQDADGLIITSPAPYVRSAASLDILAAADLYLTSGGTIFLYGNVIDAATHKIINLGNGSAAQDAAAFGQITAANAGALALSGGTLTGSLGIGESPVASAVLDVASTTQGFLPPRMTTTQMNAISSPAEGLEIYATDTHQWMGYNGSAWVILG